MVRRCDPGLSRMSIITAFDRASRSYDGAAQIQTDVATHLIADAAALAPRSILDIGCGTGLVTALAQRQWPAAKITGLDAAPAMLATARAKVTAARFVEADAMDIRLREKFDLIVSSMVLHWLPDPAAAMRRWQDLLAPGGALFVAVPVAGSLSEWQALCASEGVADRLWPFPARDSFNARGETRRHTAVYDTALAFLKSLHHTGAYSSAPQSASMRPATLRKILQHAPQPFRTQFTVAYLQMSSS